MSEYVNVGVRDKNTKADIPTKAALKRAIVAMSGDIELYETTMGKEDNTYTLYTLVNYVNYTVTGPNPYTSRKWYATVSIDAKSGHVVIK